MDYEFQVDNMGDVISICSATGGKTNLTRGRKPMLAFLEYIKGWEPVAGKVVSTSSDLDEVARIAASFYEVPFVSYLSSKTITLDEYLDLGPEHPGEWIDESGSVWILDRLTGNINSANTGLGMDLTLPQRMKLVQGMNQQIARIWRALYETDIHGDETPYMLGDFHCRILETNHGLAFFMAAVDEDIPNRLIGEYEDSRICAYKLKGEEWKLLLNTHMGIRRENRIFGLVRDTLIQIYRTCTISDEVFSKYMRRSSAGIGNNLLYEGADLELIEASVDIGEEIHPYILDLMFNKNDGVKEYSRLGQLFGEGSYPAIVINGTLFASHLSSKYDRNVIYEGQFLKIYNSGEFGSLRYVAVKYKGEEYLVNQYSPVKSLKKLGKEYVNEYKLFNTLR